MVSARALAVLCGFVVSVASPHSFAQTTWIRDVRVLPCDPALPVLEHAWVALEQGDIAAVSIDAPTAPAGEIVDGSGCSLLPGWFDMHVHLGATAAPIGSAAAPQFEAFAQAALACGVTTVFDLHGDERELLPLRARSATDRTLPRVFCVGEALTAPGGHGSEAGHPARIVATPDAARAEVRALAAIPVDAVKIMFDRGDWAGLPRQSCIDADTLAAAIDEAHALHLGVIVHAVDRDDALLALKLGADVLGHMPFQGDLDQEFVEAVRASGAAVMPTLAAYAALAGDDAVPPELAPFVDPAVRRAVAAAAEESAKMTTLAVFFAERLPKLRDALFRLHRAGVVLLPGSDAGMPGVFHGPATYAELRQWVGAGISQDAALTAFTLGAARWLHCDDRVGSIAAGKQADLMLVEGDPRVDLSALARIRAVWRGGVRVDRAAIAARFVATAVALEPQTSDDATRAMFTFDDESGALPKHQVSPEQSEPGKAEVTVSAVRDYGDDNKTGFMRIEGSLARGLPHRRRLAALLLPDSDEVFMHVGSAETGFVRFRMRAAARGEFRVRLPTRAVEDGDAYSATVAVDATWRTYRVPFARLAQVGFGKRVSFDPASITGIEFATPIGGFGTFRLDIDDVEFGQ